MHNTDLLDTNERLLLDRLASHIRYFNDELVRFGLNVEARTAVLKAATPEITRKVFHGN